MESRIETVARAICAIDKLDPDAVVSPPDYAGELRSGSHHDIPQWQTKAREAARFVAMFDALSPAGHQRPDTMGTTRIA